MRRPAILLSLLAIALAIGLFAGGSLPALGQASTPTPAGADVVGTWRLINHEEHHTETALLLLDADGTLVETDVPVEAGKEGEPPLELAAGLGVWEATGEGTIAYTFDELATSQDGLTALRVTVRGTLELSADGQRLGGPYTFTVFDETGAELFAGSGSVEGARMTVEPMATPTAGTPVA